MYLLPVIAVSVVVRILYRLFVAQLMRLGVIDKVACALHNSRKVSDECVLSCTKGCPFINLNLLGYFCWGVCPNILKISFFLLVPIHKLT